MKLEHDEMHELILKREFYFYGKWERSDFMGTFHVSRFFQELSLISPAPCETTYL